MSLSELRSLLVAVVVSACSHRGSAQLSAEAQVDKHAQGTSSACNLADGKGLFEKYGKAPFQWTHYCNDEGIISADADHGSWLKCAGNTTDYLCLGANIGITMNHRYPVAITAVEIVSDANVHVRRSRGGVVAVSGCTWVAGKGDIIKDSLYGLMVTLTPDSNKGTCTATTSRKGNFLLMRLANGWNPYEGLHQPLMAFATIARLGLNPHEVSAVQLGPLWEPHGKMYEFAWRVLSRGGPVLHLDEGSSLCLENVILPIPGEQSFLLRNRGIDDPFAAQCSSSPVLLGFADYVKDSFAVNETLLVGADAKLRITLPLRKPSPAHPKPFKREMNNSDELGRSLKHSTNPRKLLMRSQHGVKSGLIQAQDAREEANHAMMVQLVSALRSSGEFDVREVVPPEMTIDEQVQLFSNTDLLIAPHGGSLTWQILMPACGQVIEFCDHGDRHFVNVAHYADKKHTCLKGPAEWGSLSFNADIPATLKRVKAIKKEWQACRAKGA